MTHDEEKKVADIIWYHRILIALCLVIILGIVASCARPQPYGEDIWLGLEHINRQRGSNAP